MKFGHKTNFPLNLAVQAGPKKRNRGLPVKFRSVEGFVVLASPLSHARITKGVPGRTFRMGMSALVDIPEFYPATLDEEYDQTNY